MNNPRHPHSWVIFPYLHYPVTSVSHHCFRRWISQGLGNPTRARTSFGYVSFAWFLSSGKLEVGAGMPLSCPSLHAKSSSFIKSFGYTNTNQVFQSLAPRSPHFLSPVVRNLWVFAVQVIGFLTDVNYSLLYCLKACSYPFQYRLKL